VEKKEREEKECEKNINLAIALNSFANKRQIKDSEEFFEF
jgi:hypothetical protein